MTTRNTILAALQSGLAAIKPATYTNTVLEAYRGFKHHSEMPNRPALCFVADSPDDVLEATFDGDIKTMNVDIWGYVNITAPAVLTGTDSLAGDVEKYLRAWTYANWTEIRNLDVYEAGPDDQIGMFKMSISVGYYYTRGTP